MKHIYNPAKMHHKVFSSKGTVRMLRGLIAFVLPLLIFSGCMEDDFDQNDLRDVCPRVESRTPAGGEDGVRIDSDITVTFNKAMNPESIINESTFIVRDANGVIPGSKSFSEQTAVFTPTNYLPVLSDITVEVKKEVRDLYDFNLEDDVTWTFKTGTLEDISGPYIIDRSPKPAAVNVVRNAHVIVEFNEPIDPATINTDNFMVLRNGEAIVGSVYYSNKVAWFMPENYLESFTGYEAVLTTDIADPMGNNMEEEDRWSFTTSDVIEHIPNAVDLRSFANYVMLSGTYIMNDSGASSITGDVGLYPGVYENIIGIDTLNHVDGTVYVIGAVPVPGLPGELIRTKKQLAIAYEFAKNANIPEAVSIAGNLGGATLTPGVYNTHTLLVHGGDLTLDAQGNPHQYWIFQVESLLETTGNIILTGGADPRNIYWQVGVREILGPNVLIGDNTSFAGNILSRQGISMGNNAHITGRLLVMDGGIRLDNSTVVIP
jgi:hypothetical protein